MQQLFLHPRQEWQHIFQEPAEDFTLFRLYFIPFSVFISIVVCLLGCIRNSVFYSLGYTVISFISTVGGIYLAYLICREYLSNRIPQAYNIALNLIVYSSVIFIGFHSIAATLPNGFFSQLLDLCSLIFLRALYTGIENTPDLPGNQKTNLFIVSSLSIIFIPTILQKLLMILFHIPIYNL